MSLAGPRRRALGDRRRHLPRRDGPDVAWARTAVVDPWGSCQFLANFRQNVARFQLHRRRSLQENTCFAAFFKIYKIIKLKFLKFGKILQI